MNRSKASIILIDDEVDLCVVLSAMLSSHGYTVNYYHTIKDGLAAVKEKQPDWVIMDNNLPDGLGWTKVNDVIDLAPNVNIIKISANPDSPRDKNREFVHYLIKPINVNSILTLINKVA